MNREPLLFHMMMRQGIMWFTLEIEFSRNSINSKWIFYIFQNGMHPTTRM